jgi:hypothetical protein
VAQKNKKIAIKKIAFQKDKLYSVKRMRVNKHATA